MIEKEMVNDALNNINSALTSYANAIAQTENTELRSTLKQMRDQAEKSQYELYTIAKNLNYYTPAQQASEQEIMKVKSEVSGNCSYSSSGSSSMGNSSSMSGSGSMSSSSSMSGSSSMTSSTQSQGLLDDIDEQKKQALQQPPKQQNNSFYQNISVEQISLFLLNRLIFILSSNFFS